MNDHRAELATLHRDIDRIERELRFLRLRADDLESRIGADSARQPEPEPIVQKAATIPPPLPPIIQPVSIPEPVSQVAQEPVPVSAAAFESQTAPAQSEFSPAEEPALAQTMEPKPSFEMRLGTFWFVRIGIVMLLTTMVFLGNYAYQHYVPLLSPFGKVILLYAASLGLIWAGAVLPRKHERLKNYGQVLFAGGLAAVYFTTYAAHHFPNLRIIQSAVLDGTLLLAWTAFIVWLSDRKKSEVLAVFAIGLAFYAALVTNVGNFTLISNLILAVAAVFFLVRNRWFALSFLSLFASYGSYFYWRYFAGSAGLENQPALFAIVGYWLIFTSAVFLTRHETFAGVRRASFLSFNNGAAFALLTMSIYRAHSGDFWKLALGSGVLFLALAGVAKWLIKDDQLPRRAYLAQGLFLMTLGFMTKFTGPTLGLVLAVESALLLVFSTHWKSNLLRNASFIVALLGAGWLTFSLRPDDPGAWLKAASLGLLLLFQATWASKTSERPIQSDALQPWPAYFTGLAICSWLAVVFSLGTAPQIGPILVVTGAALTLSYYLLRVREIVGLSQLLVLIGQAQALVHSANAHPALWSPLTVIGVSIALSVWWKRQNAFASADHMRLPLELLSALAATTILYAWLPKEVSRDAWLAIAASLTIGWTLFGGLLRSWAHVVAGQIFLLGASGLALMRMVDRDLPPWHFPAALVGAFLVLAAVAHYLKLRDESKKPVQFFGSIYQWFAAVMTLVCVMNYVPVEYRFITLAGLFMASLVPSLLGAKYTFGPGAFLAAFGLGYWALMPRHFADDPQNLTAILMLGVAQWTVRRKSDFVSLPGAAHTAWILTISAALWIYVSRWMIVNSAGAHFYLTASWALLAFVFFVVGLLFRERPYRWAALVVLAASLGRVVILDVWKLETIYRIISFLALSIVLLALGYIYSRFQDKFAKWL